eukprot:scaffold1299_cov385-Pavlova_lutheri.AAC.5
MPNVLFQACASAQSKYLDVDAVSLSFVALMACKNELYACLRTDPCLHRTIPHLRTSTRGGKGNGCFKPNTPWYTLACNPYTSRGESACFMQVKMESVALWSLSNFPHHGSTVPSKIYVASCPPTMLVLPRLSFDEEEYALNREAVERFSILFGPFTWDLFASPNHAQCPAFFTQETLALAQEWANLANLWAHPPCCLIDTVIGKAEAEPRALVTTITPHWPEAPWFPHLQHLATY